jgi:hypothetical protein
MSVNDDASYEIMIEFVADYGFDVLRCSSSCTYFFHAMPHTPL